MTFAAFLVLCLVSFLALAGFLWAISSLLLERTHKE